MRRFCWATLYANHQPWCMWVWLAAVLIGWPWMIILIRRDHIRTHRRTKESKIILDLWTWQMLTLSLASVAALVIPGFLNFQQR